MLTARAVTLGTRTLQVSQLKLGQLKQVRNELNMLLAMRDDTATLPTPEQIEAMVRLVQVSAVVADHALTVEALTAIVDELPFDVGLKQLAEAVGIVMERSGLTKKTEESSSGEVPSPAMARSISSGSTASSSLEPDGPSPSSTS